jgi:hypothetical protein
MKKMKVYDGQGGEEVIDAYQFKDLEPKLQILRRAEQIWLETWVAQGSIDEGSCCGGKGLEVDFVRPRQRYPRTINVASCNFVQGNIAAYKSHGPALKYLKENGINARYNDGWMD